VGFVVGVGSILLLSVSMWAQAASRGGAEGSLVVSATRCYRRSMPEVVWSQEKAKSLIYRGVYSSVPLQAQGASLLRDQWLMLLG